MMHYYPVWRAELLPPVRIERDENFVCASCDWIYPCGEGAGYAGGITSAAMDGMKVAEAIIQKYKS